MEGSLKHVPCRWKPTRRGGGWGGGWGTAWSVRGSRRPPHTLARTQDPWWEHGSREPGLEVVEEEQARGGTCHWVIKKFGLGPKGNVAPQESFMPAETRPDEGISSGCPRGWVAGGVGTVRNPARDPALEAVRSGKSSEYSLVAPQTCPSPAAAPPWALHRICGPMPHPHWLPGESGLLPRGWGISPIPTGPDPPSP